MLKLQNVLAALALTFGRPLINEVIACAGQSHSSRLFFF